ncbi:MAG: hypothetical protein ACRC50_05635 [Gaiella sp.]
MSRVVGLLVLVTVSSLLLLAAGCGSDSDSGEDGTTEVTETDTSAGGNERLTEEQWAAYEAVQQPLQEANATATKALARCGDRATSADELSTCVGDDFTVLANAVGEVSDTLASFQGTVTGACAEALDGLLNYARPAEATATQMQTVIDEGNLAAYPGVSANLEVVTSGGKDEAAAFEEACKPV